MENINLQCKVYEQQINKLFSEWKQQPRKKTFEKTDYIINHVDNAFICDGIVSPERWFRQNIRPLFLLKEAHSAQKDSNLIDYLNSDYQAPKMWERIADWTDGLMHTTSESLRPFHEKNQKGNLGNDLLKQIAVVNVKKSNGQKQSNYNEILAYAKNDHCFIRREIEICDPTVIICGYTGYLLNEIFCEDIRKEKNDNLFYSINVNGHRVMILDYWHPANRYPDLMNYYGLMAIYQMALKN